MRARSRRTGWWKLATAVLLFAIGGAGAIGAMAGGNGVPQRGGGGAIGAVMRGAGSLSPDDSPRRPGVVSSSGAQTAVHPGQPGTDRVSVLVHFDPALARGASARAAVRGYVSQLGGTVRHEYPHVMPHVLNMRGIPQRAIDALRRMPGVVRVEEDRLIQAHLQNSTPLIRGLQSQLATAGLSADGTGVRVCVIDTGIDSDHSMYATRIDAAAGWDFVNNDPNPEDDNGHGAHVAGVSVGGGGSIDLGCPGPVPFQGVAPNATLIGVKVLGATGSGTLSDVMAGIDRCASPTLPGGQADVINLSLGAGAFTGACDADTLAVAANNAVDAGVVVVASAGNEGNANAMGTPACASKVISVGAVYDNDFPNCENPTQSSFVWCLDASCISTCTDNTPGVDSLICFSNQSDSIDVAAPGCLTQSASTAAGGTQTTNICGTSQASPHVAGLAALILSADPLLAPAAVRQIIRDGAVDLGPVGFDREYGFGRVDVINSLQLVAPPGCTTNADCDDGLFCNGAETCDLALGCQPGTDPCPGQSCDEARGFCFTPPGCNNNGVCDAGEDCGSCPADCISGAPVTSACGNGICEPFARENCKRCPQDCAGTRNGPFCCGNGEDGANPVSCADARCSQGGFACSDSALPGSCCGDGVCEGIEDGFSCAIDCGPPPACGDGVCDPGETMCSCSADCGLPALTETSCTDGVDNDCDGFTDCNDQDCAADPACQQACLPKGDACTTSAECCDNRCRTKKGSLICD